MKKNDRMNENKSVITKLKEVRGIPSSYDSNQLKKILISVIAICLSLSAVVVASKALFTGEKETGTHIVTGNLNFEFKRTNLTGEVINDKGYLDDFTDPEDKDLKETGANAFDIDKMVPGATYKGTFYLKNIGTTAFDANISFTNLVKDNDYLLNQIKIAFEYNNVVSNYSLSQFDDISLDLGVLECNDEIEFDLTISLPSDTTNEAQNKNVNFDLRLEATQVLNEN